MKVLTSGHWFRRFQKDRKIIPELPQKRRRWSVSIWPNVSPPRHADMLLVSIFQLFFSRSHAPRGNAYFGRSAAGGAKRPSSVLNLAANIPTLARSQSTLIQAPEVSLP